MTTRNFASVGIGYHPDYIGGIVMNRTGATVVVGELVMLDMKLEDAGFGGNAALTAYADNVSPGSDFFSMSNVINPSAAGLGVAGTDPGFYFGIVDDLLQGAPGAGGSAGLVPGADDTAIHVCWKGFVKVMATATVGVEDTVPGEYGKVFYATAGSRRVTATYTAAKKGLGRWLEEVTTAGANAFALFNGIEGVGTSYIA